MFEVVVIGAGLAGSEASWQIAQRGVKVILYEMRPFKMTPAHKTDKFAELVCSNSLRSKELHKAVGLLKEELKMLKSLIMESAINCEIEGGKALVVDRECFANYITQEIFNHPLIKIKREEVTEIPKDKIVIVATGPLTSESLAKNLSELIEIPYLHFYDAISPIVYADSINWEKVFVADRYGEGEGSYVNCPLTKEEYEKFVEELLKAEKVPLHPFEDPKYFEGCLPIEVMAERGKDTLRYGPMKPTGLIDPKTGKEPYAVVQLRPENKEKTLYNMVGFQTKLKYQEQIRIFRMIPGLEKAEFARLGSIHRNTFVNAPLVLEPTLQLKKFPNIFLAGQITGVEGYVESTAMGLIAGINAERLAKGKPLVIPPKETAIGALINYLQTANPKYFQPMNINWGLFPPLEEKIPKKLRYFKLAERALKALQNWIKENSIIE
ncbi:Methylenetetrahydrofolate--tRNA-(uracil-5-)-methyltransferase trmFO [Thermodesulfobacterium geofontis OPF15]|uniref:Methylenetetrahydrofolate--tRNA-(uracil-5-)-methyltransferase TrmFO n=1 Tax=Thermodesulfobacterium geofontis (strain OPF15) TaxID=795359 RepID=F8C1X2_THEGP|nr:methylenetetrahydrofolate--tRNA-(uracil(54)-C(5))-methyltransferase (FADH(2)-oxidizing) TrmFO [Thermodesulfobacterium geofontis]AEH23300.1 Methylenetetrahydrofolate--tRNA-(uracil-5-)-methyltransferase trmFO [Thermodesulfobacterium geofontis OPF15]